MSSEEDDTFQTVVEKRRRANGQVELRLPDIDSDQFYSDEDDEPLPKKPKLPAPRWSEHENVQRALDRQRELKLDPEEIFGIAETTVALEGTHTSMF